MMVESCSLCVVRCNQLRQQTALAIIGFANFFPTRETVAMCLIAFGPLPRRICLWLLGPKERRHRYGHKCRVAIEKKLQCAAIYSSLLHIPLLPAPTLQGKCIRFLASESQFSRFRNQANPVFTRTHVQEPQVPQAQSVGAHGRKFDFCCFLIF